MVTVPSLLISYVNTAILPRKFFREYPVYINKLSASICWASLASLRILWTLRPVTSYQGETDELTAESLCVSCVAGSELLRQALGSEVIRVFATSAPFLGFPGRLQAFQSMVLHSKIIPV